MIVCGCDPSLTGTGICVLDQDFKITHVSTLTNKLFGIPRLIYIRDCLNSVITECKPDIVFIEGYAMGIRGTHVFNLGELGGVLRVLIYESKLPYVDVSPTTLKKYICGNGLAKKNVMLEQTFRKFGVGSDVLKDDNQVDAYCLARFGINYQLFSNGDKYSNDDQKMFLKCDRIIP